MKLTDFARASEPDYLDLKRRLDDLPAMKTYRFENCELLPECRPNRATVAFYKEADLYALFLEKPVRYSGQSQAMKKLADGKPFYFADVDRMKTFFGSMRPSTDPPPEVSSAEPEAMDNYDLDQLIEMVKLIPPTAAAEAALDCKTLQRELEKTIMGQEAATEAIAHQVALHLNKKNPKKPLSIVAWGTPGTGKTETAKALSAILSKLTGRQYADIKTDLNTFTEAHSVHLLTGAPPGYIGYGDTPVFEAVANNPYTIFIFDELDKAHPEVLKTFMAILDEGRLSARKQLQDGSRSYDFRHCIFVFTSNYQLGVSSRKRIGFGFSDVENVRSANGAVEVSYAETAPENAVTEVTKRIFRDTETARKAFVDAGVLREIASRFNLFVEFKELSAEAKVRILAKQVIETGFEYNIRLAHVGVEIMQGLIDASSTENVLTVRSFKCVIEGYLAAAFAEAGLNHGSQAMRLTGTIEAPELIPA